MTSERKPAWDEVRGELLSMAEADIRLRSELASDGSLFEGYHPRMQAVHDTNAARLGSILDSVDWPGERQVGREAADAAWLIVQHAIAHPALQRRALRLMETAVARGDAPARQAAMLEDRIRTLVGRAQRFGTQFDWDADGQMSPMPIEDPEGVDVRRQEVGLDPLEQEVRRLRAEAAREQEKPPADWHARQAEMDRWCRKTGWRA